MESFSIRNSLMASPARQTVARLSMVAAGPVSGNPQRLLDSANQSAKISQFVLAVAGNYDKSLMIPASRRLAIFAWLETRLARGRDRPFLLSLFSCVGALALAAEVLSGPVWL